MLETTAVAVLLAVYGLDDPDAFTASVDSILAQDFGGEIHIYIGIDGPISDSLEQVISLFSGSIHCVSRSKQNLGLAETLNRLIVLLADESYVFRMDADDISLPWRFRVQIDHLVIHPWIDIVGGGIVEFLDNGKQLAPRHFPRAAQIFKYIARATPLAHPTVCFRREALLKLKSYPITGTNEDIALWFKALSMGMRLDNVEMVVLRFRLSAGAIRRRSFAKARLEFMVYANGIYQLNGASVEMLYPMARFVFRLAPPFFVSLLYKFSSLRTRLLSGRRN